MGTDRSAKFEGPCLCGRGLFRVDDCSVDHSWPTAVPQWYESRIDCPDCSARFSLQQRGRRFVLVERTALHERELRESAVRECESSILSSVEVRRVLGRFEEELGAQRSVAAIYRLLRNAGLESYSEGTFRRHWSTPAAWIQEKAHPKVLSQIFRVVGAQTDRLEIMLRQLHALEDLASQQPEPFGEPVYIL